jgi:hypothetical protein
MSRYWKSLYNQGFVGFEDPPLYDPIAAFLNSPDPVTSIPKDEKKIEKVEMKEDDIKIKMPDGCVCDIDDWSIYSQADADDCPICDEFRGVDEDGCNDCSHTKKCHDNIKKNTKKEMTTMTRQKITKALTRGAKTGVANKAGDMILAAGMKLIGKQSPALTKFVATKNGKLVGKLIAATVLMHLADVDNSPIPHAEEVSEACGLVMEAVGRDALEPLIDQLTPELTAIAKLVTPKE